MWEGGQIQKGRPSNLTFRCWAGIASLASFSSPGFYLLS
jgi:hypothetical protein